MVRAHSTHGGEKECILGFCAKPEGKRKLEKYRRTWEDDIKMDRREIGWGGVNWINLI
jgi:hypothetical protein